MSSDSKLGTMVRSLFAPPVFADEDKSRIARLLNIISFAFLAMAVLGSIAILVQVYDPISLIIGLALILLTVMVQILMRRGLIQAAGLLMCSGLWLLITGINWGFGGVSADTFYGYVLVIVLAALVAGRKWGFVVAAASCAAGLLFILAEANGLIVEIPDTKGLSIITGTAVFVLAAVMMSLAIQGIEDALRRARETNRALETAQAGLQERITLEREQREQLQLVTRSEQEQRTSLQRILDQVRDAVAELGSAISEILAATQQHVASASQQSAAIAQTTTTVDEVKVIADQSVMRAQEVTNAAQRTVQVSRAGQQAVQGTVEGMDRIKEQVEGIATNILALSQQTQQIGEIIATVGDLAAQSNMLALNAAVEAARAGEHGKGFAVVAAEVRRLAEQSRYATGEVRAILLDIQQATNRTVMATEEGIKRVDEGMQLASQTGEVIRQLAGVIDESAQAAMQMVAGGRQQVTGIDQIALAMGNIHQATLQSLASTRQAERAAQDLNTLALRLAGTVTHYQV